MASEPLIPFDTLTGFLFVFARVGGALVFLPMPGLRTGPTAARSMFAFCMAIALFRASPHQAVVADGWLLTGILLCEAAFGILMGLLIQFVIEALLVGMQIVSVQAGYSYASTIDPTTQAESGVLIILAQLVSGLLFFALGMHRQILLAFARSLERIPPGSYRASELAIDEISRAGAAMFSNGLLVMAPVVGLMLMADIVLAVAGRVQTQLQVLSFSFSLKMLLALALLAWTATLLPAVFERWSGQLLTRLNALVH